MKPECTAQTAQTPSQIPARLDLQSDRGCTTRTVARTTHPPRSPEVTRLSPAPHPKAQRWEEAKAYDSTRARRYVGTPATEAGSERAVVRCSGSAHALMGVRPNAKHQLRNIKWAATHFGFKALERHKNTIDEHGTPSHKCPCGENIVAI